MNIDATPKDSKNQAIVFLPIPDSPFHPRHVLMLDRSLRGQARENALEVAWKIKFRPSGR
jgi:hypothetical protein